MKIVVKLKNLLNAVAMSSRVIQSRNSVEVLGNLLLSADKNSLEIKATNLEVALKTEIGAKVEQAGEISVPARILNDLLHSFSEDTVQLIADKDNLTIKSDYSHTRINGTAASEFPTIPTLDTKHTFNVASSQLADALASVLVCTSVDETRPVLAGVSFMISKDGLVLAATDSYRLGEIKIPIKSDQDLTCIVPAKTLVELQRLLGGEEEAEVQIGVTENEIQFVVGKTLLIAQLTEGKYPDYRKIFPEEVATRVVVDTNQLIEAVKINSLFARESSHGLTINISKDTLTLAAQSSDVGENSSKITVQTKGKDAQISLNARYLLDVLGVLSTKDIELRLNDKLDPCVIVPTQKNANSIHVIMPLRS